MEAFQDIINDSELNLIYEIRKYKNNINKCKTTLIESNRKMKELVFTTIQECEIKIKEETNKYKDEINKIEKNIKNK